MYIMNGMLVPSRYCWSYGWYSCVDYLDDAGVGGGVFDLYKMTFACALRDWVDCFYIRSKSEKYCFTESS